MLVSVEAKRRSCASEGTRGEVKGREGVRGSWLRRVGAGGVERSDQEGPHPVRVGFPSVVAPRLVWGRRGEAWGTALHVVTHTSETG